MGDEVETVIGDAPAAAPAPAPTAAEFAVIAESPARPSSAVQDAVVALEQQHKRLQTDFFTAVAREVANEEQQETIAKLEASEAKNAALEARIVALEAAQAAAEKRESNKWSKMNPALVAMLGSKKGGGMSEEEKAALGSLGEEMSELRTKVLEQQAYITELHDDLHHMADVYFHPIGGRPQGSAAVPDGLRHLQPPTSSANDAAAAPSAASPAESGGGDPLRRSNRPAVNKRESKLFDLEEKLITFQSEVEEALAAAGIGGGSAGSLDNKLAVLEERIVKEVKGVAKEAGELKAGQSELQSARNKSENALSELSEHIAAQQVKLDILESG